MSISGAMWTGISGLNSHSDAMSVISDNIANVNTIGYKASRANFSDVLGDTLAGKRLGNGSAVTSVQTMFGQGALLGTGGTTDLAIQGEGFFMVSPPGDSRAAALYTRAGQFSLDANGFVVNQQGARVRGYAADAVGNLTAAIEELQLPRQALPATATEAIEIDASLDAQAEIGPAFDIASPDETSDFQTAVTVYDSLGVSHQIQLFFTKTDASPPTWAVNATVPSAELDPAPAGERALLGTGTMTFNSDGSLASNTLTSVTAAWSGAAPADISIDFGTGTADGGTGFDGITTAAGNSAVSSIVQDGNTSGDLSGIDIGADGRVTGLYTNGENRVLGQIATARFTAPDGLLRHGNGLFAATIDAGQPTVGAPGAGGHGSIVSGSLEASNVDLASEFVTMIAVQRGYQGNSRTITTADDMLSEAINIKR